jgi:tetratricopeptide (TPR) repeat protein
MREALRVIGTVMLLAFAIPQLAGCGTPEEKAQSHYERGKKLLEQKELAKAIIEFKNALQLKKDHVGAWRELAKIEESKQNWQGLGAILRNIADLDPKDINVRLQLARLMLLGNALDESLKWINAAGELDPRHAGSLALKAAVLLKLNDSAGALREASVALAVDPANVEALIVLAAERLAAGDGAAALAELNRQTGSAADNFGLQLFKMKIHERMGNLAEVEALLRKFAELYPNERAFRRQLVKLYVDQKRMDDAEKRYVRYQPPIRPTSRPASMWCALCTPLRALPLRATN